MSDDQEKADSTAENVTDSAADTTKSESRSDAKPAETGAADTESADTGRGESRPAGANETTQVMEQHRSGAPDRAPRRPGEGARAVRKGVGLLASLVKLIGVVAALILVVHIVFVVAHANPANSLTGFVDRWAQQLTLGLQNLFQLGDPTLAVLVSYGVPAIVWLILTTIIASVLRKL